MPERRRVGRMAIPLPTPEEAQALEDSIRRCALEAGDEMTDYEVHAMASQCWLAKHMPEPYSFR